MYAHCYTVYIKMSDTLNILELHTERYFTFPSVFVISFRTEAVSDSCDNILKCVFCKKKSYFVLSPRSNIGAY